MGDSGQRFTPPPWLSRRGFLLGGMATLSAVTACSGPSAPRRPTTAARSDQVRLDFENGSLGAPLTGHVGASVSTAFAHTGRYGCRLEPRPGSRHLASLVIDQKGFLPRKPWAAFSMRFRLVTRPASADTYMNLFEIGNTATTAPKSQFTAYFKHDRLVCDFNSSEVVGITAMPVVGAWHSMEVVVGYGATTYVARVRFDGRAVEELVSQDNKTAESVRALWIHYPTVPVDYTMDVDEIRMATSDTEPDFLEP